MATLDSVLFSIVHHSVSDKKLRLDLSDSMISQTTWTETLASSQGQLEQLRVLGTWLQYSCLIHYTLPHIPSQPQQFFQIMQRCILHPNVYTQFFIKTGICAPDEDPFNVLEDGIVADAWILLCAMLLKTNGPEFCLSWFKHHFEPLFLVIESAYATHIKYGTKFLIDQNQRCFPRPAAMHTLKRILPGGLTEEPMIFKSVALLRILRERLTPSFLPCGPPIPRNLPVNPATTHQPSSLSQPPKSSLVASLPCGLPIPPVKASSTQFPPLSQPPKSSSLIPRGPPTGPVTPPATQLPPFLSQSSKFSIVASLPRAPPVPRDPLDIPPVPQRPQSLSPQAKSSLFASLSTFEKEEHLRNELLSRRKRDIAPRCRQAIRNINACPYQPKRCSQAVSKLLSDVGNMPLRK
ncbi:hypothetical protein C8R43DRAFT_68680 [Mycena crocata]|nr:hypothetical protein C8R43DRAFT_68680 [Mycena crocata]